MDKLKSKIKAAKIAKLLVAQCGHLQVFACLGKFYITIIMRCDR